MIKPRIIILMHYMELGGAEMSLIGLLHALDPERVDVDLFIYSHQGPLMKYIPKWVNLLPEVKSYSMIERPMVEALRNRQFGVVWRRMKAKQKHKHFIKRYNNLVNDISYYSYMGKELIKVLPKIQENKKYDLCISFLLPHDIAISKVRAKSYIAWLHTDYSTVSINTEIELPVWNSYDHIVSISSKVGQAFLDVMPNLKKKILNIENFLSVDFIRAQSLEFKAFKDNQKCITLLSVGRYTHAKNYDNVPAIAHKLVYQAGLKELKWYIIGYGGEEALIRSKIAEFGMEDYVILLGKRENPYPYIKACDIYVQPSRYEGKSVTVREAQILGRPVVVTNYPTASSQIKDGVDGKIVPLENESCANALAEFIKDKQLQQKISQYLSEMDFNQFEEICKIYQIING